MSDTAVDYDLVLPLAWQARIDRATERATREAVWRRMLATLGAGRNHDALRCACGACKRARALVLQIRQQQRRAARKRRQVIQTRKVS